MFQFLLNFGSKYALLHSIHKLLFHVSHFNIWNPTLIYNPSCCAFKSILMFRFFLHMEKKSDLTFKMNTVRYRSKIYFYQLRFILHGYSGPVVGHQPSCQGRRQWELGLRWAQWVRGQQLLPALQRLRMQLVTGFAMGHDLEVEGQSCGKAEGELCVPLILFGSRCLAWFLDCCWVLWSSQD